MKRIILWTSILSSLLFLNIYLGWYSDSIDDIELSEQPQVEALEVEREFTPSPTEASNQQIRLMFTGDVMLGRTVMTKSIEMGDYLYPFRKTADRLNTADLTVINLENPVTKDCPVHTGGFIFCSVPESLSALTFAGVDIANLANNHTLNWGSDGMEQTITYLREYGIDSVGYDNVVYKTVAGTKIAFLGFDFVTYPYELRSDQLDLIDTADRESDILIINVHWGNEYKSEANVHQRNMARRFVDLGADLIVGHHPHWVQDVDCYSQSDNPEVFKYIDVNELRSGFVCYPETVPVYYSLGNFVFDQMWSEETKKGGVLIVTIQEGKIVDEEFLPTYMNNWAQPEFVNN